MKTQIEKSADSPQTGPSASTPARTLRERLRRPLMIAFPALLAAAGATDWIAGQPYVSTDDAFVRAAKDTVNARVSGQVVEIAVHDNQRVRKGQLLFRIDPQPYQIAIDQAQADVESARLQIEALKTKYRQQLAELQSARDSAAFEGREYDRKKTLLAENVTSKAVYDQAEDNFQVATQNIASTEQQIASTVAALNGDPDIDPARHPAVRAAQARLDRARLDLSYAQVRAPDDGIVTRVDDLQIGDYVQPGAAVFSLLSSRQIWIEGNFRETALAHMRAGEAATIAIDAYPDVTFSAHIVSMSPGTGSDFAILPPENATGNWVKVIQRLPVRLELDKATADRPLFSGMSATVQVDTGYRTAPWHPLEALLATEADR